MDYKIRGNILEASSEIKALLTLIDDPDETVYQTVTEKLYTFGKEIIPHLESFWEYAESDVAQERVELIIHRLHFTELKDELTAWKRSPGDLLTGALLVSRIHYPELDMASLRAQTEKLRKNAWLELHAYLTPMETVQVINSILFHFFKVTGAEVSYDRPEHFMPAFVLNNKKGNAFGVGILYQSLCAMLDIPLKAISVPRQFLLAYFSETADSNQSPFEKNIRFYVDCITGQFYSKKDVENYFHKLGKKPDDHFFRPLANVQIVALLLKELSKCFTMPENQYKQEEIKQMIDLLADGNG